MSGLDTRAFAIAVALCVVAWLGYQVVQGLRTGQARAAGFRFSRADRPGEFWLILSLQAVVALIVLAVVALELAD